MTTLTAHDAIAHAARTGAQLHKYADPTDGARTVSLDEAREIARVDASLIYCEATRYRLEVRPDAGWRWAPAIQGTLNQTGDSDEDASTFDSYPEDVVLELCRREYGPSCELRVVEVE